ncbi:MAG: hypothetical protein ABJL72_06435 [Roseobacter sp.]
MIRNRAPPKEIRKRGQKWRKRKTIKKKRRQRQSSIAAYLPQNKRLMAAGWKAKSTAAVNLQKAVVMWSRPSSQMMYLAAVIL